MEYVEDGERYEFEYQFCPNTGEGPSVVTCLLDGTTLDGQIWIECVHYRGKTHWLHRGGRRPAWLSAELLGRMEAAAAAQEGAEQRAVRRKRARKEPEPCRISTTRSRASI